MFDERNQFAACLSRIVFDEVHYYKSPTTNVMSFIRSMNRMFTNPGPSGTPGYENQCPYKWYLSGTPIDTSPDNFTGSVSTLERDSWSEPESPFYYCQVSFLEE